MVKFVVIGVLVAGGMGFLLFEYLRFRQTPTRRWAGAFRRRIRQLGREQAKIGHERARIDTRRAKEDGKLLEMLVANHLNGLPVDKLIDFPGIGRVTAQRLESAGMNTIGRVKPSKVIAINGIGQQRAADIASAVATLETSTRDGFRQGSLTGQEHLRRKREALESWYQDELVKLRSRREGLGNRLVSLGDYCEQVGHVTFTSYLFHRTSYGLPAALIGCSIDQLEIAVAQVEEPKRSSARASSLEGNVEASPTAANVAPRPGGERATPSAHTANRVERAPTARQDHGPSRSQIQVQATNSRKQRSPREILGLDGSRQLTHAMVRAARDELLAACEPEEMERLGEEFRRLAEAKRIELNSAAGELLRDLGEEKTPEEIEGASAPQRELRHQPDLDDIFGI